MSRKTLVTDSVNRESKGVDWGEMTVFCYPRGHGSGEAPEKISSLECKLRDLFPPDQRETPWLVRLAILRDDIHEERQRLVERVTGSPTK